MKYVVTGGAGFIGSHLVGELSGQDHEVVILDNLFSGKMENIAPFLKTGSVSLVRGSVTDLPLLKKTFEAADGIFHEGAVASVPRSIADPPETHAVNLTGTLNVLVAARDCGVKKVVFASSAAVYGNNPGLPKREDMIPDALSPYAVSKLAGEYYGSVFTRLYGVRCTSLRYFNVFGPRQDPGSPYSGVITKFISNTLGHRPLTFFGDGNQTRDFVYVQDVVQANIRAMACRDAGVFNIAGGRQINLHELADLIIEITGITVPVTCGPPAPGDVRDSCADISRARSAFGYAPAFTVRDGLARTVEWFRQQSG
jgi:UDP-glucose 4-epimerase